MSEKKPTQTPAAASAEAKAKPAAQTTEAAADSSAVVEEATAQGYFGVLVDPEPNETYTVAGSVAAEEEAAAKAKDTPA